MEGGVEGVPPLPPPVQHTSGGSSADAVGNSVGSGTGITNIPGGSGITDMPGRVASAGGTAPVDNGGGAQGGVVPPSAAVQAVLSLKVCVCVCVCVFVCPVK